MQEVSATWKRAGKMNKRAAMDIVIVIVLVDGSNAVSEAAGQRTGRSRVGPDKTDRPTAVCGSLSTRTPIRHIYTVAHPRQTWGRLSSATHHYLPEGGIWRRKIIVRKLAEIK